MRQQLHHRFHTGRCFPGKRIGSITIVASINKSIVKCGHRLTRVFSEFTHLVAPSCGVKGFEVIGEKPITASFDDVKHDHKLDYETCSFDILPRPPALVSQRNLLPPLGSDKKGTIVLNLDETLVHTSLGSPPLRYDFIVTRVVDGVTVYFYVFKRFGVDEFLEIISKKYEGLMPFYGDELWDQELMKLAGLFKRCNVFSDMRDVVNWYNIRVRTKEIR
ncbi:hypothetical protein V6N12_000022 [Hibiscus sabdariffa]|uniref:FCP1 homology domain-containing protein n=1 Tax=Hibiscus sabdariffa TaxID=183260 RepID=A0ABR1ZY93_9ROSI